MLRVSICLSGLLILAGCQASGWSTGGQQRPQPGTMAWFELVEQHYPTSDGQGHGPDYGSQEWCDVVYFRLHGRRSVEPVACDQTWFEQIDKGFGK